MRRGNEQTKSKLEWTREAPDHVRCFTEWDPVPFEQIAGERMPNLHERLRNGDKLKGEDAAAVSALERGCTRRGGWEFDFRPFLRRYWAHVPHYGIQQFWAVNKTALRAGLRARYMPRPVEVMEVGA